MTPATPESPAGANPTRRILTLLAKIVVSVGLMALLLSRTDATRLWAQFRAASLVWILAAFGLYFVALAIGTWRWALLLEAQGIELRKRVLLASYLVATFFNNFLPSNIGGDVIRIQDTARQAQSKTLATTVVLADRIVGLFGLVLVAAIGATAVSGRGAGTMPVSPLWLWLGLLLGAALSAPVVLAPEGFGRLLRPLRILHPEWVEERIGRVTQALFRFRSRPLALAGCLAGAIVVQVVLVGFYAAIARGLAIPVPFAHLAVLVPLSFVVQMLPVSLNGLGVREAVFSLYFTRLGLPIESALTLSLVGAGILLVFSLTGAAAYLLRRA